MKNFLDKIMTEQHFNVPALNTLEMYPRRRHTEFYRSPEPRVSIQSRLAEHPTDKLVFRGYFRELPNRRLPRIRPPSTSETAVMRNNYFS